MAIKKGYVDTTDGQIHYRAGGRGPGTPLVFLHQTPSSSQMYEAVMALLEDDYAMIALDTPGFGQSYLPPQPPTIGYYITAFLEALDGLEIHRFNLFGHHTGAAIAAEMALVAPERIERLLLCGPVCMDAAERARWQALVIKPMVYQEDGSHLLWSWQKIHDARTPPPLAVCHREVVDALRAGDRWHEAYVAVFDQDSPAIFPQIRCPLLLLCGERDILRPSFDQAYAARPDAWQVVLAGGGYLLDTHPADVAAAIRAFL